MSKKELILIPKTITGGQWKKTWTYPETETEQIELYSAIQTAIQEIPQSSKVTNVQLKFSAMAASPAIIGDGAEIFRVGLQAVASEDENGNITYSEEQFIYNTADPTIRVYDFINGSNHFDVSMPLPEGLYANYPSSIHLMGSIVLPLVHPGGLLPDTSTALPGKFKCYFEDSKDIRAFWQIGPFSIEWEYEELNNINVIGTASPAEGGVIELSSSSITYDKPITLSAIANEGYTFDSWVANPTVKILNSTSTDTRLIPVASKNLIETLSQNNNTINVTGIFRDLRNYAAPITYWPNLSKVTIDGGIDDETGEIKNQPEEAYYMGLTSFRVIPASGYQIVNVQIYPQPSYFQQNGNTYSFIGELYDIFQGEYYIEVLVEKIPWDVYGVYKWNKKIPLLGNIYVQKKGVNDLIIPSEIVYQEKGES